MTTFKWLFRAFTALLLCASLAFNLLLLTSSATFTAASAALAALGVSASSRAAMVAELNSLKSQSAQQRASNRSLNRKLTKQRQAAQRMGQRLSRRTARIAATQIAELPLKAVPVVGVAALVGGTAWELSELCAGLNDLDELYVELEMPERTDGQTLEAVCDFELPSSQLSSML